ncbi:MAG TPA: lipocalin-like domain-containing protein [Bryobacteraceae bacterium]
MKPRTRVVGALFAAMLAFGATEYRLALPGYRYQFPRDHFNHPDFQTEWWYYTGNLHTSEGRRFGFELTFFRQGTGEQASGVWDVHDIWMAHLALSDIDGGRFLHTERLNRAGADLAGAAWADGNDAQHRVWNGNWSAQWTDAASQRLEAVGDHFVFRLDVKSAKAPVIHGKNGISQKGEGEGRASHYISLTRLITSGEIELDDRRFEVEGLSWMDHEFFTDQLDLNQTGWDWFSLQWNDGSEIMLYRLRHKDGSTDSHSAGTYVDAQGRSRFLSASDFLVEPGKIWTSSETHGRYPIEWRIRIPPLGIDANVTTKLKNQEMTAQAPGIPSYWEGAIDATGAKPGSAEYGAGYLEMTGYALPTMLK